MRMLPDDSQNQTSSTRATNIWGQLSDLSCAEFDRFYTNKVVSSVGSSPLDHQERDGGVFLKFEDVVRSARLLDPEETVLKLSESPYSFINWSFNPRRYISWSSTWKLQLFKYLYDVPERQDHKKPFGRMLIDEKVEPKRRIPVPNTPVPKHQKRPVVKNTPKYRRM